MSATYLCGLCLLVQQRQSCQVLQEGVGRIENFRQEVETLPLIVVQDLDKKNNMKKKNIIGYLTGNVLPVSCRTTRLQQLFSCEIL